MILRTDCSWVQAESAEVYSWSWVRKHGDLLVNEQAVLV